VRRARTFFRREREIFLEDDIELIDRLTRRVRRRCGVAAGEGYDALPTVTLAPGEKDYAIPRRYEGRSAPLR